MWRLSKSAIPCSLSTRTNRHVNPKLMRSIRVWQWRWMNSKTKSLLEVTGRSLMKRMAMWEGKTSRTFSRTNSLFFAGHHRTSSKALHKFPGKFKPILGNESVVSLWRKRHFFKMFKTLARFSPRRDVFAHLTFLYANVDRHWHLLKTMFDHS